MTSAYQISAEEAARQRDGFIERLLRSTAGVFDIPSIETGTVMRPDALRRYAVQAGFRDIEILPIENYFSVSTASIHDK